MPRSIIPSGIRTNNTRIADHGQFVLVTLYQTVIAEYNRNNSCVLLSTGGFDTPTTIRRMNECLYHWGFTQRVSKADFRHDNTKTIYKSSPPLFMSSNSPETAQALEAGVL